MSQNKYKICVVTATGCGPCDNFKLNILSSLKNEINRSGKFDFYHINAPSTSPSSLPTISQDKKQVPSSIRRFVQWFPSVIIIKPQSWESGMLEGSTFDQRLTPMTVQNIMNWINERVSVMENKSAKLDDISVQIFEKNNSNKKKTLDDEKSCNMENGEFCSRLKYQSRHH